MITYRHSSFKSEKKWPHSFHYTLHKTIATLWVGLLSWQTVVGCKSVVCSSGLYQVLADVIILICPPLEQGEHMDTWEVWLKQPSKQAQAECSGVGVVAATVVSTCSAAKLFNFFTHMAWSPVQHIMWQTSMLQSFCLAEHHMHKQTQMWHGKGQRTMTHQQQAWHARESSGWPEPELSQSCAAAW